MNAREFLHRFPHASKSALASNCGDADPQANRPGKDADPEPVLQHEPLGTAQAKNPNTERFLVRLVSVRKRSSDTEALVPKWHVDCLRYAGIIPDDTREVLECFTTERKCAKGEEEKTEIEKN